MEINPDRLKRRPEKIKEILYEKNGATYTKAPLYITFPQRFVDVDLAVLGPTTKVVSIVALVDEEGNYGIAVAPVMMELAQETIDKSGDYIVLSFPANSQVITNNTLLKSDYFLYIVFNDFYSRANIPWYIEYNDLAELVLESKKYAGAGTGQDPLIYEIFTSLVSRDPDEKKRYYRQSKDFPKNKPVFVGLNNIYYGYDNTGARLIGGYFGEGLVTSVMDPETKTSKVSEVLRK